MNRDSRILCQKLRYMNMVIQEIQIQLSFFYDEFVHHATTTSSTSNKTLPSSSSLSMNNQNQLGEKDLLLLEQGKKNKIE